MLRYRWRRGWIAIWGSLGTLVAAALVAPVASREVAQAVAVLAVAGHIGVRVWGTHEVVASKKPTRRAWLTLCALVFGPIGLLWLWLCDDEREDATGVDPPTFLEQWWYEIREYLRDHRPKK